MRALLIARLLTRRRLRRLRERPVQAVVQVGLLLVAPVLRVLPVGSGSSGRDVGAMLAASGEPSVDVARLLASAFAGTWLLLAIGGGMQVTTTIDDVDCGSLLVHAAGMHQFLLGRTIADESRRIVLFSIWVLVGIGSVALGAGAPIALLLGLVGFSLLTVSASMAGRAVGLLVYRTASDRGWNWSLPSTAAPALIGGLAALGFQFPETAIRLLSLPPLGWFAAPLFVRLPGVEADPIGIVGGLAVGIVASGGGYLAFERLARDVWFREHALPETDSEKPSGVGPRLRAVLERRVDPPIAAIGWRTVVRRLRAPLPFIITGAIGVILLIHAVEHGLPDETAAYGAVYLAVAGAAVLALNPLADEGPVLALILTSPLSGTQLARGYAVGALSIAVPTSLLLALGTAAVGNSVPLTVASLAVVGPLTAGATGCALAAGVLVPRYEAANVLSSESFGLPGKYATVGFLLTQLAVAAPFVLAVEFGRTLPVLAGGTAGTVALALSMGLIAGRYAANRLDGYRLS